MHTPLGISDGASRADRPTRRMGVLRAGLCRTEAQATFSRGALDQPMVEPAELWVAVAVDEALLLGAFQRVVASTPLRIPVLRRGSGGPAVVVAPGTVHVALRLAHPAVLAPCDAKRIVNRSVRPLLRALTKVGHPAAYFGRDWVSVAHRPAAWVGFGHDASTGRTLFEAFVGVKTSFAETARASFLGKPHGSLEAIAGKEVDPVRLADAIVDFYVAAYDVEPVPMNGAERLASPSSTFAIDVQPPWAATVDEAMGLVGAGYDAEGVFRVGGDLLASRDALSRIETRAPHVAREGLAALIDDEFLSPAVALDGVRSLSSLCDVVARALGPP